MIPKAIIFDFFGVISSEVAPLWFNEHFPKSKIPSLIEQFVYPADRGEVSYDQLMERLADLVNSAPSRVRREWEAEVHINGEVVSFIKKLKKRYKLGLLSDAPADFLRQILSKNHLNAFFDEIIISSEEKLTKKDKTFFSLILRKLGVDPPEAILVEDSLNNLRVAKAIGLEGFIFNEAKDKIADLVSKFPSLAKS